MPVRIDLDVVYLAQVTSKEGSSWLEPHGQGGPFRRSREGGDGGRDVGCGRLDTHYKMQSSTALSTCERTRGRVRRKPARGWILVSGTSCKLGPASRWVFLGAVLSLGVASAVVRVFFEPVASWSRADEWRELLLAGTLPAKSASECC
jgi:hypothetical protein